MYNKRVYRVSYEDLLVSRDYKHITCGKSSWDALYITLHLAPFIVHRGVRIKNALLDRVSPCLVLKLKTYIYTENNANGQRI